jgi:hypothetical protein
VLDGLTSYEFPLRLSADSRRLLCRHAQPVQAAPSLFRQEGDACESVTFLARGVVRVSKRREGTRGHRPPGRAHVQLLDCARLASLASRSTQTLPND